MADTPKSMPHEREADPTPPPLSIHGLDLSCGDPTEGDEGGGSSWLSHADREKKRRTNDRKEKN